MSGAVPGDVISEIRREVCRLHAELVRNGLVAWTSGNVSARVPGAGLMVIKPSGVAYDDLTPASMVVCDGTAPELFGPVLRPLPYKTCMVHQ